MRFEQPLHPMAAQQRQQPALAAARLLPARHQLGQIRAVARGTTAGGVELRQLRSSISGSRVSTAKSGISPTIERTLSGIASPVGQVQHVVVELVLVVPQADALVAADVRSSPRRCRGSARRTWWRCPRRRGLCRASSSAMRIRFRQYIAIQLVPSAWLM